MTKKSAYSSAPKKVIAVGLNLLPRLIKKSEELQQNANHLANLLMEGGLDAMDAESIHEIPIVQLYRTLKGKTMMTSKATMAICSAVIPEISGIDQEQQKVFFDLINKHEGPLTTNILKTYVQFSAQIYRDHIEHRKQAAKLQQTRNVR